MEAFLAGVHAAGAPKVHLGMVPTNTAAHAFYSRLGFTEIPLGDPNVLYMGRDTAAVARSTPPRRWRTLASASARMAAPSSSERRSFTYARCDL